MKMVTYSSDHVTLCETDIALSSTPARHVFDDVAVFVFTGFMIKITGFITRGCLTTSLSSKI